MSSTIVRKKYRSENAARTYGESWEKSLSARFRHWLYKFKLHRAIHEWVRGKAFIDIPSGNGRLVALAQSMGPRLHVGADLSFEMLRVARENGLKNVVQCDVLHLPFKDNTFDVSVCARFLHHFEDDERQEAVKEILRISRVSVLFYDTVYAVKQISRIVRSKLGMKVKKISGISLGRIQRDLDYADRVQLGRWWVFPVISAQLGVVAGPAELKRSGRSGRSAP